MAALSRQKPFLTQFYFSFPAKNSSPTRCFNEESCLSLKQLEGYLVVLQPDAPQISLSGVGPHLARPAPEFEGPRGVSLFPELRIVCSLSHAVNTAAQGMEGGGGSGVHSADCVSVTFCFYWSFVSYFPPFSPDV